MRLVVRQGVVGVGIGLAFVALWTGIYPIRYYTDDGSSLGYLLILLVLASLLLSASILLWRELPLWIASALGLALLGYYLGYPLIILLDHFKGMGAGDIESGGWLGMVGAALIALGGAPVYARRAWVPARTRRKAPFYVALGLGAVGFGLVIVALFLDFFNVTITSGQNISTVTRSYWSDPGDHALTMLMLIASAVGLVLVAASAVRRLEAAKFLALGAAALVLGAALFYPLLFAFGHLSIIKIGGWLAPAAALLAVAGAAAAILLDSPAAPE
ncbi:MAG: hypothetical protein ACXVZP_09025 [Gaiellaceae bacterium]